MKYYNCENKFTTITPVETELSDITTYEYFFGIEIIPVGSSSNGIVISHDGYNGRTLIADHFIMHINYNDGSGRQNMSNIHT